MAPSTARRRRTVQPDDSSDEDAPQTQATQRRRRTPAESADEEEEDDEAQEAMDVDEGTPQPNTQDQVVKKLIRYALACEYQRVTIKRAGITEKVIGKQRGSFKRVFDAAQAQLRQKFGMEMVPVPTREKVTMKERRAAAKSAASQKASTTTTSYILTSTLNPKWRTAAIMPPSIISSQKEEAQYVALCTLIISLISLSPGDSLPDSKLLHHLKRLHLDINTPLGTTEKTLDRMRKESYLVRITNSDANGENETVDWMVGGRGKVEIGAMGVRGFVREVYGEGAPAGFDKRLQKGLGLELTSGVEEKEENDREAEVNGDGDPGPSRRGRARV